MGCTAVILHVPADFRLPTIGKMAAGLPTIDQKAAGRAGTGRST
jgi:hypothetical protein